MTVKINPEAVEVGLIAINVILNEMVKFGGALSLSPDLRILAFNSGIDSNASQVSSTSNAMWSSSLHITESRRVLVSGIGDIQ